MFKLVLSVLILSSISGAATLQTLSNQLPNQQNLAIKAFNTSHKLKDLLSKRHAKDLKKTNITLMSQSTSSIGEAKENVCELISKWQVSKSYKSQLNGDLETITMNVTTATVDENCGEQNQKINTFIDTSKEENMNVIQMN